MTRGYSLRRRLVFGLLVALLAIAALAVADSWREAQQTATRVSDRVLAGSILAIAERVIVAEDGTLEVDVPYVALEMLTSSAQDRVFYRVDGPACRRRRGQRHRLRGQCVSRRCNPGGFTAARGVVGRQRDPVHGDGGGDDDCAEPARAVAAGAGGGAARDPDPCGSVIVWFAVTLSLAPLYRLRNAIGVRTPDDLSPIKQDVPREVEGLIETINSFMTRLDSALGALRHFTGNASHQLRTPMAIMRTQLALASRAKTEEERRAAIAAADGAVEHAERVLAQLLLLARIDEAASDRLTLETIDLAALAKAQTAELVPRASAAGIDLGYEGAESAMMRGDAMLLGELLRNLIENAIAYAGQGAEATVGVEAGAEGVRLSVADTGPGVAEAKLPALRQRFGRDRTDKPGAGLGLSIVEEIAALFGGTTEVASDAGRGFRVTISLPVP